MSTASSPTRFNGEIDNYYDLDLAAQVSAKMQVPKRIKLNGDEDSLVANDQFPPSYDFEPKIDMSVPDRILVMGHDEHIGVRAPPKEMLFDNAVFPDPPDYSHIRLQTPPQVLTLDEHFYPSLDDPPELPGAKTVKPRNADLVNFQHSRVALFNDSVASQGMNASKDLVPAFNESISMTPGEEVVHLRRQLAKLNRRVMGIEMEIIQRQRRDRIIFFVGISYLVLRTVLRLV
ncbi:transport and Golgi organization protein 11 isoform X2 [Bemisia tabaci]|uniref:transport and Golgi organization protein 11 isoform X2 n=1 Tax=Bemisia tabaci TaxID=7038 RepID=UPI0008F9A449|nr:PREDICTED: transport and Golgi organization protein 11 isoform X2 [Bemisia tabaci]